MKIEMCNVDLEFVEVRRDAVEWMIRVSNRFGFCDVSVVMGVSYFDMFFSGVGVKKRKPWMGQLTAVACLSLAAKMEEVAVPLLVDLQVAFFLFKSFGAYQLFDEMSLRGCVFLRTCFWFSMHRLTELNTCLKLRQFREWSFLYCLV